MKRFLASTSLCVALGLGLVAPAALASQNANKGSKPKAAKVMSPRADALKKCNERYGDAAKKANDDQTAAVKDAKNKKGKERADAMKAANKAHADALALARKKKAACLKEVVPDVDPTKPPKKK